MPYDNLIQRGDVAAFTTEKVPGVAGRPAEGKRRPIQVKPPTPIPRPAQGRSAKRR